MRAVVAILTILAVSAPPCVAGAHSSSGIWASAPADEYFGRLKMSVIEIRNRLNAFDGTSSRTLRVRMTGMMNNVEDAMMAWQRRYPADPWLPGFLERLEREYKRAGLARCAQARHTMHVLAIDYPRSVAAAR
jgi:hypothetical protein